MPRAHKCCKHCRSHAYLPTLVYKGSGNSFPYIFANAPQSARPCCRPSAKEASSGCATPAMDSHDCVICLCAPAQVRFHPCAHRALCAPCTPRLQTAQCPLCRASIQLISLSHSLTVPFAALQQQRQQYDDHLNKRVAKVLICAQQPVQKAVDTFVNSLCKLFPLPPNTPPLQLPPLLALTSYTSPATPNAFVDGVPVLFHSFSLPETPHQRTITALQHCQPDFIFLTCLLHPRHSFHSMLPWDSPIRQAYFPSVQPKRMWLYLAQSKDERNLSRILISPNLHFKEDLYHALNAIPLLYRPLTYHVINPDSAWTRAIKRLAKRAVYHVVTSRALIATSYQFR